MRIETDLLLRFIFALFCITGSIWLTMLMPDGSVFTQNLTGLRLDGWQGPLILSSLTVSAVILHLFKRS